MTFAQKAIEKDIRYRDMAKQQFKESIQYAKIFREMGNRRQAMVNLNYAEVWLRSYHGWNKIVKIDLE